MKVYWGNQAIKHIYWGNQAIKHIISIILFKFLRDSCDSENFCTFAKVQIKYQTLFFSLLPCFLHLSHSRRHPCYFPCSQHHVVSLQLPPMSHMSHCCCHHHVAATHFITAHDTTVVNHVVSLPISSSSLRLLPIPLQQQRRISPFLLDPS